MWNCGCADPIYNFKGDAFANEKKKYGNKDFAPCRIGNETESKCLFMLKISLKYFFCAILNK